MSDYDNKERLERIDQEFEDGDARIKELETEVSQWKAQATRRGISYVELFAEKQKRDSELSAALNENANLKDENAALKAGEAGKLLAAAQEEARNWKGFVDRISESFRKYREEVESQAVYQTQRKVIEALYDENRAARKVADAAVASRIAGNAYCYISQIEPIDYDARCELAQAQSEAEEALNTAIIEYRSFTEYGASPAGSK